MKKLNLFMLFFALPVLSGCTSFGRGVAEAFLDKEAEEDKRICQAWGKSFSGLDSWLDNPKGKNKVLMVHGVGDRLPGYSTQLLDKLGQALELNVTTHRPKDISLTDPLDDSKNWAICELIASSTKRAPAKCCFTS